MGFPELDQDHRREEFVRLYEQHRNSLYGYILSLVPNVAAADEVSQNTSLVLWEEFDRFNLASDFRAWARTIAYYQVLTYRKARGRERVQFNSELLDVLADRAAVRSDELEARHGYLSDCLGRLPEFKRQVIQLYCCVGMTVKTVAEKLGRNVAAVEKTLARTRRALYDCVETASRREDRP
jgi:RNA polymerase sigma-70 factor, ECF subfamily